MNRDELQQPKQIKQRQHRNHPSTNQIFCNCTLNTHTHTGSQAKSRFNSTWHSCASTSLKKLQWKEEVVAWDRGKITFKLQRFSHHRSSAKCVCCCFKIKFTLAASFCRCALVCRMCSYIVSWGVSCSTVSCWVGLRKWSVCSANKYTYILYLHTYLLYMCIYIHINCMYKLVDLYLFRAS